MKDKEEKNISFEYRLAKALGFQDENKAPKKEKRSKKNRKKGRK